MGLSCRNPTRVDIAGISVLLTGDPFLKTLSPVEKEMLAPFIHSGAVTGGCLKAGIKFMDRDKSLPLSKKESHDFAKLFPCLRKKDFGTILKNFYTGNAASGKAVRRINSLVKGACLPPEIVLGERAVFFSLKGSCNSAGFIHTGTADAGADKLTPNLTVLKLLFYLLAGKTGNTAVLHASSVDDAGNGYVFAGPSNCGKTTAARLMAPARILSDDISVIRKLRGKYRVFPNPWWNRRERLSIPCPQKPALLKGIFFIRRSGRTAIRRMPYKEALATLLYRDWAFQQKRSLWTKGTLGAFYVFCLNLAQEVPFFDLAVRKTPRFGTVFRRMTGKSL